MSKIDNFRYPTPIPAKVWGCSLWRRSVMLGSAEREKVRLIGREIIFNLTTMPQRYSRTDGQLAMAVPRDAVARQLCR